jgi:hypothetical protein
LDIGNDEVVDPEQKLVIAFAYLTTQMPLDELVGKMQEEARAGDEREEAQRDGATRPRLRTGGRGSKVAASGVRSCLEGRLHCDEKVLACGMRLRNEVLTDKDGCRLRWKGLRCAETVLWL